MSKLIQNKKNKNGKYKLKNNPEGGIDLMIFKVIFLTLQQQADETKLIK